MNVLVLGGAGYIGCVLVPKLLGRGHHVSVVDWGVFPDGVEFIRSFPSVEYTERDVRYLDPRIFEHQDAVIDLAAISNDPAGELDPEITLQVNRDARIRNATVACAKGVARYILASSCSVYGRTLPGEEVTENGALLPQSTYAVAAIDAERGVLQQCNASGSIATVVRQGTVYGYSPRMRWDLAVNVFVRSLYLDGEITVRGSGEQWRPLVSIQDTAGIMANLLEADHERIRGQVFNVVGENWQMYRLAEELAAHFGGCPVNYTHEDKDERSYRVSSQKLIQVLHRFCTHRLLDAAEELHMFLEDGVVQVDLPSTVDVYRQKFGKLSDLSARVFQV